MKYFLSVIISGAMLVAGSAQARDYETIRIGIDVPYEPFVYRTPEGDLAGFEIDLGNELCARASLDCSWVEQDWDGIIPGLLSRKYDAILSSMGITPERKNQVLFSLSYYNTPSIWITPRESDIDVSDTQSLESLSVGVQRGTVRDVYLSEKFDDVLNIRRYSSSQEAGNDLDSGRIDMLFEDYTLAAETIDFLNDDSRYKQVGESIKTPTSIFGEGSAVAFRKRDRELADKFDQAICEIYADGTFDALMHEYFDYDIATPPSESDCAPYE